MNRIATVLAITAVSAAALPVPLAGAKTGSGGFVQKVNGICGDAVRGIDNLSVSSDGTMSAGELRRWNRISDRMITRLHKVKAPAYAAKRYRSMLGGLDTAVTSYASVIPAARAGHTKAVEDLLYNAEKGVQKFSDIAVDLNVGNCASMTGPGYSDTAG
jgi:hypothetical protein